MAIAQNIGAMLTALLPALFATVAPPESANVPLTVGALAFAVTPVSALAAFSARETYRVHLNDLAEKGAPSGREVGIRPIAGAERGGGRIISSRGLVASPFAPSCPGRWNQSLPRPRRGAKRSDRVPQTLDFCDAGRRDRNTAS